MYKALRNLSVLAVVSLMAVGCSTAPSSSGARADLQDEARQTIAMFKQSDPTINQFFNSSVAYAVYPSIGKGGLVLGGAYGRGVLYENGVFTNYCDLTQGTVGLQVGGQEYSEIIFFENQGALSEFKNGAMTFAAQASAVAVSEGVAATRDYDGGVAVFVADQDGLMAEASIGGQKFSVISASDSTFADDPRINRDPNVYATPIDNDMAWRNDSTYNRQYDAAQSRIIQGQVTAINDYYPTRDSQKGRQITLRANDGQIYTIHLGPASYLDRSNAMTIREGDHLTITGSPATFEGRQVIMARDVVNNQNQRLELRGSDGSPHWNMNVNNNPQR